MVRTLGLSTRTVGFVALGVMLAVLAGCGSSGSADPTPACTNARSALAPVSAAATRAGAAAAARTAGTAFGKLNLALGALAGTSPDPEALANLRNAAGVAALDYRDLASLLIQPGSGLLGPLRSQGVAAYAQFDHAAAKLGAPACRSKVLGRDLFDALVARTTAPAGPNLPTAARTACQDLTAAYGTSQVAIDTAAALTQLERSAAVLDVARNDLAEVTGEAGQRLRASITRAGGILGVATGKVTDGANPATTTTHAFAQATSALSAGFLSAGVVCAVAGA